MELPEDTSVESASDTDEEDEDYIEFDGEEDDDDEDYFTFVEEPSDFATWVFFKRRVHSLV